MYVYVENRLVSVDNLVRNLIGHYNPDDDKEEKSIKIMGWQEDVREYVRDFVVLLNVDLGPLFVDLYTNFNKKSNNNYI